MVVREVDGEYRLYWPETGGFGILVTLALVYFLVSVATPILVEEIALFAPEFVPEPLTTILAVVLWVGTGLVLAVMAIADALLSVHAFDTPEEAAAYLQDRRVHRRRILLDLGRSAAGALLIWASFDGFVRAFRLVIATTVIEPATFEWPFTVQDGVWMTAFLVGFVLFAGGVDRVIVDGLRGVICHRALPAGE